MRWAIVGCVLVGALALPLQTMACESDGDGNWSSGGSWANCTGSGGVPGSGDTVTIESGDTITIDASGITIAGLTVDGSLEFDNDAARTIIVNGSVQINGGSFLVPSGGNATHALSIGGNLTNDGTFDMTGDASAADVTFTNDGHQTVSGSGTTAFNKIMLDMGTDRSNTLDVLAVITLMDGGLTLTNGTFKLSSTSTITPFSGNTTIGETAGFHLNHEGATSNWGSSGSLTVHGALTVTNGTMTIGTSTGNRLDVNGSSATLTVEGGVLNLTGRYKQTNNSSSSISGGTINVATAGEAGTGSEATFQIPGGSFLTMSGGTVHIYNANGSTAGGLKITTHPDNSDITGGTFIIGSGSSTSGDIEIDINDSIFNLEIDAGSTTPTVLAGTTLNVAGAYTVTSGQLILENDTAALITADPAGIGTAQTDRQITGNAGWRMLSVPRVGLTVADLAGQNLVQGLSDKSPGADANIYTSYTDDVWNVPESLSDPLTPGEGFVWYFFDNDQGESNTLPVTLTALNGSGEASDQIIDLNSFGWTLIGNPYGHAIDMRKLVGVGAAAPQAGQVWDNAAGSSGSFISTATTGHEVAHWQGVFVENVNGATAVIIPNATKTGSDAAFYKAARNASGKERFVQLTLSGYDPGTGRQTYDEACVLYFAHDAHTGWDSWDTSKLTPLTTHYATLAVAGERDGDTWLKAQESQSSDLDAPLEIPLVVTTYDMVGDFTLAWPRLENIPDDWQLMLVDHEQDQEVDLREASSYAFTLGAGKAGTSHSATPAGTAWAAVAGRPIILTVEAAPRFTLHLRPGVVETRQTDASEFPADFRLEPNYPNPFNPTTTIRYAMPEAGTVRVTIYDALGRQVAVLADEWQPAGWHETTWEAARQASGLYLYRLESAGRVLTRTMLLLK